MPTLNNQLRNQQGITPVLVLAVLAVGILVGLLLIKNPTFFNPKADEHAANSTSPVSASRNLYNGLIAYWNFNETAGNVAADLKGVHNGTATGTTIVDGKIGKARDFNAKTDIVDMGNSISMTASKMSVSAWIYYTNPGIRQAIISHASYGAYQAYLPSTWFFEITSGNRLELYINKGNSAAYDPWFYCRSNTILQPNNWYLVTATHDGTSRKLYINGVLDIACTEGSGLGNLATTSGAKTIIGHDQNKNTSTDTKFLDKDFMGVIDELGIWDRALSDEEIKALAAGAVPQAITAFPNPCTINPATSTCTSKISWDYIGKASNIRITVKEAPGSIFSTALKASQDAPWITSAGATFEVYSGNTLIDSLVVAGTATGSPAPATPTGQNTCVVGTDGKCSAKVTWDFGSASNVKITVKEAPGALFASGPKGEQTAPWITETGTTFEAYSGTTLLGSVFVKGVKGSGTSIVTVVIPGPTATATPVSPAPATSPATNQPTASAPPVTADNPAYQYHYDPNNSGN